MVLPALEAPPAPLRAALRRPVRAVELVRADRPGDDDVDPADGVDELAETVEVDECDVVHIEAGEALDGAERERRASDLIRGVDLREADLRDLHLEIARDRQERESPFARVCPDEHDRVGSVGRLPTGRVPAVGAEDEDRGRVRDEQPVGRRELAADAGRDAFLGLRDPARDREVAPHCPGDDERDEDEEPRARATASGSGVAAARSRTSSAARRGGRRRAARRRERVAPAP